MEPTHIRAHSSRVNAVRFTPDGLYVVSAGADHQVCIHALRDGRLIRRLIGHSEAVYDVAVTPNGRYIVSGSADGTVRVWHSATGREVTQLKGPDSRIVCVDISPNGRYVVAGDGCLWVWRLPDFTLTHCLQPSSEYGWAMRVHVAAITPDSRAVLIGGERRTPIYTLDLRTGETLDEREDAGKSADTLAVSPDGRLAAAWCDGGDGRSWGGLQVWSRLSGQRLFSSEGYAYALAFTMDSNYLISIEEREIIVYIAETGLEIVRRPCAQQILCLAVADDGHRILVGNEDGSVTLFALADVLSGQASDPLQNMTA